jgi:hypothetical protein
MFDTSSAFAGMYPATENRWQTTRKASSWLETALVGAAYAATHGQEIPLSARPIVLSFGGGEKLQLPLDIPCPFFLPSTIIHSKYLFRGISPESLTESGQRRENEKRRGEG